jgi:hypothetical protein
MTDEQRSQTGWIDVPKCEVIFARALSNLIQQPRGNQKKNIPLRKPGKINRAERQAYT